VTNSAEEFSDGARPRIHRRGSRYAIFDDLLAPSDYEDITKQISQTNMKPTLSTIDSIFDGFAYHGTGVILSVGVPDASFTALQNSVVQRITRERQFLGINEERPLRMTFAPWAYPSGSRLSWHNDSGAHRLGAFVFFAHVTWSPRWGGELSLIDSDARESSETGRLLDSETDPVSIFPRPNRLVIFRVNTMHAIQRVDQCAGDRLRHTYTGFISYDE
jgi:Rps23 Pro-64 3,4-dihydroxylase Tpa1-like proline 4-hydroxylase